MAEKARADIAKKMKMYRKVTKDDNLIANSMITQFEQVKANLTNSPQFLNFMYVEAGSNYAEPIPVIVRDYIYERIDRKTAIRLLNESEKLYMQVLKESGYQLHPPKKEQKVELSIQTTMEGMQVFLDFHDKAANAHPLNRKAMSLLRNFPASEDSIVSAMSDSDPEEVRKSLRSLEENSYARKRNDGKYVLTSEANNYLNSTIEGDLKELLPIGIDFLKERGFFKKKKPKKQFK